jgi:hypothetical protein
VVGWDLKCCESDEWIASSDCAEFSEQPCYHVLVDERDWGPDDGSEIPPAAYLPQPLLTAPELEEGGKAWVEVGGCEYMVRSEREMYLCGCGCEREKGREKASGCVQALRDEGTLLSIE